MDLGTAMYMVACAITLLFLLIKTIVLLLRRTGFYPSWVELKGNQVRIPDISRCCMLRKSLFATCEYCHCHKTG